MSERSDDRPNEQRSQQRRQGQQGGRRRGQQGQRQQQPQQGPPPNGPAGGAGGSLLAQWVISVTALFAIAGTGFGIKWILLDGIDEELFELDDEAAEAFLGGFGEISAIASIATSVSFVLLVGTALAAVFVGAWLGTTLSLPDPRAYKFVGASLAAGSGAFFFVSFLLFTVGFDGISVEFAGLLITTLVTALFGALIAIGGVWTVRNQFPKRD